MAKMKVHELAKELEIQSKDVLTYLNDNGIEVKAANSSVEDAAIEMVKAHFGKAVAPAKAEPVKEEVKVGETAKMAEQQPAEAPKKKKKIIIVSNSGNSKAPGQRPQQGNRPQGNGQRPMQGNGQNRNQARPATQQNPYRPLIKPSVKPHPVTNDFAARKQQQQQQFKKPLTKPETVVETLEETTVVQEAVVQNTEKRQMPERRGEQRNADSRNFADKERRNEGASRQGYQNNSRPQNGGFTLG